MDRIGLFPDDHLEQLQTPEAQAEELAQIDRFFAQQMDAISRMSEVGQGMGEQPDPEIVAEVEEATPPSWYENKRGSDEEYFDYADLLRDTDQPIDGVPVSDEAQRVLDLYEAADEIVTDGPAKRRKIRAAIGELRLDNDVERVHEALEASGVQMTQQVEEIIGFVKELGTEESFDEVTIPGVDTRTKYSISKNVDNGLFLEETVFEDGRTEWQLQWRHAASMEKRSQRLHIEAQQADGQDLSLGLVRKTNTERGIEASVVSLASGPFEGGVNRDDIDLVSDLPDESEDNYAHAGLALLDERSRRMQELSEIRDNLALAKDARDEAGDFGQPPKTPIPV